MGNFNIVQILGVGISGFGFLLMYLAYKLVLRSMNLVPPNALIIGTVNRFMLICFIMTLVVGCFTFMDIYYKNQVLTAQQKTIKESESAINAITTAQQNNQIADSIIKNPQDGTANPGLKDRQKLLLQNISKYLSVKNDTGINRKFKNYETIILKLSDSINMTNLDAEKMEQVKKNYSKYNDSVAGITTQFARMHITPGKRTY